MAETSKRTTNNSASKSRKSKNDIIRSTLGTYLKQKNYSVSDTNTEKYHFIAINLHLIAHLTSTQTIANECHLHCIQFNLLCMVFVLPVTLD